MIFKINYNNEKAIDYLSNHIKQILNDDFIIVCIGTDKFIGDCLGPMVGTILNNLKINIPIYGTIKNPIHALNLESSMYEIYKNHPTSPILAIDACLTDDSSIGEIQFRPFSISPGKGVGKKLIEVGNFSIIGIVEKKSNITNFGSSGIRLNFIFELSNIISLAIKKALEDFHMEKE